MQYRQVGMYGLKVSEISLGGWTTFGGSVTEAETVREIIVKAYESGINFFDIADIYAKGESERMMGEVLRDFPRHTLVISTKLYWPMSDDINDRGLSRKHIMESIDKSLARIGIDYVDIYFCHRWDETTPLIETIRAMDDLIHRGKILYWGTSEWTGAQIQAAVDIAEQYHLHPPVVEQPHYNLSHRHRFETEIMPTAQANGMGLVTWSPLASGVLTGKYDEGIPEDSRMGKIDWLRKGLTDERIEMARQIKPIADDLGVSRAELAIAWCLRQDALSSVISGATRLSQLETNLNAAKAAPLLTADVLAALEGVFPPESTLS
jgi:voltage-dependent potassium channel beta subunit